MPGLIALAHLSAAKKRVDYFSLPTRRLLNRTTDRMPFTWTINPYRGCEFACRYCYARYTHEFLELDGGDAFERQIYAKRFTPDTLRAELARTPRADAIAIGTATDPYQPAERRFNLTRRVLEVFAAGKGRRLSVTTKSDLILRDLDLLREIARANIFHANITVTTLDASLARLLEPGAPRPDLRVETVRALSSAGLETGVFPNPIMPWLTDSEENLDAVAAAARQAGATFLGGGPLFLKPCSARVFYPLLDAHFPELAPRYRKLFGRGAFLKGEYADEIKARVRRVRERHRLANAPLEHAPELWEPEPRQADLFEGI